MRARHVARISSRRGPTWRGPRVPLTKSRELLGFGKQFFGDPSNFISLCCYYYILVYFTIPVRRGGENAPPPIGCVPAHREIHYVMILALNTSDNGYRKNADVVCTVYI